MWQARILRYSRCLSSQRLDRWGGQSTGPTHPCKGLCSVAGVTRLRTRHLKHSAIRGMELSSITGVTRLRPRPISPKNVKEKEELVKLEKLFELLSLEKMGLSAAATAILLGSGAGMLLPHIFGRVIDALGDAGTVKSIAAMHEMTLLFVCAAGVSAGATSLRVGLLEVIGQRVGNRLRKRLFANLLNQQEMAFFDQNKTGELANRLSTDVHEVAEHLVEAISQLLNASLTCMVATSFLVYTSPELATVTLSVMPAVGLGALGFSPRIKALSRDLLNALGATTQLASERMALIQVVKAYAATSRERRHYNRKIDESYHTAKRLAALEGGYIGLVNLISNAALLIVLMKGSGMVAESAITVGELASFCMYAHTLSEAIGEVTEGVSGVIKAQGAGTRLFALLDRRPSSPNGSAAPEYPVQGRIQIRDVSFSYPARPHVPVLQGLSMDVFPGEVVAITGTSGCGKSTLALLLERFYEPSNGKITLDGLDLNWMEVLHLRKQVGMVSQGENLFSGTIRDNVTYANRQATNEEVDAALALVGADQFLKELPAGLSSEVGDRGVTLSGGQVQRLNLARCLLKKPALLVLDEATSALDAESEMEVMADLLAAVRGTTCLVITHHVSVMQQADRVVVLDAGRVVQDGTFTELMEEKGGLLERIVEATNGSGGIRALGGL
ncbi:unnamed protein product [Chrysoparadoxa australica]